MKTKEAIEFLKSKMYILLSYEHKDEDDGDIVKIKKYTNEWDKVITLLKRGEVYEQMWGEIDYELDIMIEEGKYTPTSEFGMGVTDTISRIGKIKQKYFPKE